MTMLSIPISGDIYLLLFVGVMVAILSSLAKKARSTRLRLPPGPKPLPVVGNMFDMPTIEPWKTYREWCNDYDKIHILSPQATN